MLTLFRCSSADGRGILGARATFSHDSEPQQRVWNFCLSDYSYQTLSWNSASWRRDLAPTFSSFIFYRNFVHSFDILKIPVHSSGTPDTLKKVICVSLSQALCLFLCHFHINLKTQNSLNSIQLMTSLTITRMMITLPMAGSLLAIASTGMGKDQHISR